MSSARGIRSKSEKDLCLSRLFWFAFNNRFSIKITFYKDLTELVVNYSGEAMKGCGFKGPPSHHHHHVHKYRWCWPVCLLLLFIDGLAAAPVRPISPEIDKRFTADPTGLAQKNKDLEIAAEKEDGVIEETNKDRIIAEKDGIIRQLRKECLETIVDESAGRAQPARVAFLAAFT